MANDASDVLDLLDLKDYLSRQTNWGQLNRLKLFDDFGAEKLMEIIQCPRCNLFGHFADRKGCENFYCRSRFHNWTKELSEYTDQEILEMIETWKMRNI